MCRYIYIYIPWPFPPVWGVADNTEETEFGEKLTSPQLTPPPFVLSLRNFIQEEGIPSPLAPSLLVAFYDTQRIRWCYSFVCAQHHRYTASNNNNENDNNENDNNDNDENDNDDNDDDDDDDDDDG